MHSDIHDFVFDINNSDIMHVGTDGGVYRSWNGGTTMEIVANLPLSQFYHISVDDAQPYRISGVSFLSTLMSSTMITPRP